MEMLTRNKGSNQNVKYFRLKNLLQEKKISIARTHLFKIQYKHKSDHAFLITCNNRVQ